MLLIHHFYLSSLSVCHTLFIHLPSSQSLLCSCPSILFPSPSFTLSSLSSLSIFFFLCHSFLLVHLYPPFPPPSLTFHSLFPPFLPSFPLPFFPPSLPLPSSSSLFPSPHLSVDLSIIHNCTYCMCAHVFFAVLFCCSETLRTTIGTGPRGRGVTGRSSPPTTPLQEWTARLSQPHPQGWLGTLPRSSTICSTTKQKLHT